VSFLALAVGLSIAGAGCTPFPRWSYLAVTRLEAGVGSEEFSADEISRARAVAANVATEVGMQSGEELFGSIEPERMRSTLQEPPRRLLSLYAGRQISGSPIKLGLEVSDDGRTLYFSISDYDRGTASPAVARIRKLMMARVEAEFPDAAIVHEATTLGPFFDVLS
jgi:hypothetical protein